MVASSKLVRMTGKEGEVFYIEVDESVGVEEEVELGRIAVAETVAERFDQVGEFISSRAGEIIEKIKQMAAEVQPNKVTLTFGVGVEAKGRFLFIAEGTGRANITVSCEWIRGT